jgi:hypothetical protein
LGWPSLPGGEEPGHRGSISNTEAGIQGDAAHLPVAQQTAGFVGMARTCGFATGSAASAHLNHYPVRSAEGARVCSEVPRCDIDNKSAIQEGGENK